ncbi:ASCH domain protein [Sporomusa ovata DSM 2662]|uniref:ASCH domain-containing protein n=1 Tax=Sporomusa ovata TaxID=2378 RepID=A0A0U1L3A8_9FIRM|nr:ASCH domain-containing protein [Sporomusa ovata]EQB25590.1 ASCH domain containing protein [Sporomusa ovata DSM 2662]CQR74146.1 hypothetical protein SpAn4DRAFT_0608 [Sporomusa ovata]
MKAITILQPWASLIACGKKQIETRNWATKYRGPIAIHAGARFDRKLWNLSLVDPIRNALDDLGYGNRNDLPLGAVIAIVDLVDCYYIVHHPGTDIDIAKNINIGAESMTEDKHDPDFGKYIVPTEQEFAFGDWTPGRYAWILENVHSIDPIPAKGRQRLWEWEAPGWLDL